MILFTNTQSLPCPTEQDFDRWVTVTLHNQDQHGDIGIRIVDAPAIQQLNRDYRHKDKPTNVLAFPFEAPPGTESDELGDIVICADVVIAEAQAQQKTAQQHWAHMTIHATLHLLGFDHQTDAEAEEMEALEIHLLDHLEYPNPYERLAR